MAPLSVDIPLDTPPASPLHSPNGVVTTYDPLTPPRRAASPSVPSRIITPLNVETPWNMQELRRIEKCFLGFLSGTAYILAGFCFYEAAQTRNTSERTYLMDAGTALTFFGSFVAVYLCTRRR